MDNVEAMRMAKIEASRLVEVCHKQGLNYQEILEIFADEVPILIRKANAEYWLKKQ